MSNLGWFTFLCKLRSQNRVYSNSLKRVRVSQSHKLVQNPTLSTVVFCLHTTFAFPMSPLVENFTPSFVTEITTATMIWNNVTKKLISQTKTQGYWNEKHTRITNAAKISANSSEFCRRHPNNSMVVCFWNPKMLTINVHKLHFKIRNLVLGYEPLTKNISQRNLCFTQYHLIPIYTTKVQPWNI